MDRLYSTTALIKVLDTLDRPTAFLKDKFFGNEIQFTTAEIAFDKLKMRRKLAPFVSPRVAGKARRSRGRQVTTFEPAYVKPLDEISPNENFVRLEGKRFAGDLEPEERFQRNTIQKLDDQEKEITRRALTMNSKAKEKRMRSRAADRMVHDAEQQTCAAKKRAIARAAQRMSAVQRMQGIDEGGSSESII